MSKKVCLTIDLESDYAGYGPAKYHCWEETKIRNLIKIIRKYNAKLTVFVVANALIKNRKIIKILDEADSEFHLHSYSHDITKSDSKDEIVKGKILFKKFFGKYPNGYRAPMGYITDPGLATIRDNNFGFDSSVFPSFWPKISLFFKPNQPYIDQKTNLLEIPLSTVSPFRFLITLSWLKLLGWGFYNFLFATFGLSKTIVFGFHLHDLWDSPVKKNLPLSWKIRYLHNSSRGVEYFEKFLSLTKSRGYKFVTANELANESEKLLNKEFYYNNFKKTLSDRVTQIETLSRIKMVFTKLLTPGVIKGKKILDVGVGLGLFSKKAFKLKAKVYGIDIGQNLVDETKKKVPFGKFFIATAENIPFPDNYFDIVLCTQVLRHVRHPVKVIGEIKRVTKKGGRIVVTTPNRVYKFIGMALGFMQGYKGYDNWFFPWELENLLEKKRLTIEKKYYFLPFSLKGRLFFNPKNSLVNNLFTDVGLTVIKK